VKSRYQAEVPLDARCGPTTRDDRNAKLEVDACFG
jgi:hypothetical protein